MKKFILISLCFVLLLSACSTSIDEEASSDPIATTETSDESTVTTEASSGDSFFEQMYGDIQENPTNLELYIEAERYSLDTKAIPFHVINLDNRNFLLDWDVKFEYYDDGEWITLSYKDPAYAENNSKSGQFLAHAQPEGGFAKSWESITFDDYDFTFVAGKYRITKTVGSVTLTREFELY
ncbi:MAG: membrane lipoprotein lipid attachment site-containing protein [Clostridia bacterium]|nr:membrane lipoprotein lipid attachment site-containing protein [Clostridia bacterium]